MTYESRYDPATGKWTPSGSALDATGATGSSLPSVLPGLEFAFWGYSGNPANPAVAYRVLVAGDYSAADECDNTLTPGFNYQTTPSDGDLSNAQVGQYLIYIYSASNYTTEDWATRVAGWGFNPFGAAPFPPPLGAASPT